MNPPSIVFFGGGVHGKVCWLKAYMCEIKHTLDYFVETAPPAPKAKFDRVYDVNRIA